MCRHQWYQQTQNELHNSNFYGESIYCTIKITGEKKKNLSPRLGSPTDRKKIPKHSHPTQVLELLQNCWSTPHTRSLTFLHHVFLKNWSISFTRENSKFSTQDFDLGLNSPWRQGLTGEEMLQNPFSIGTKDQNTRLLRTRLGYLQSVYHIN